MTEQQQTIARAVVASLADALAAVEADKARVKYLTCEVELKNGAPVDAHCWIDLGTNLRRLLEGG